MSKNFYGRTVNLWNKQATLRLLFAYKAHDIEADNTKKNKRFCQ